MCRKKNTFFKLLPITLSIFASSLFSQSPTSSPYSRFGIGELEKRGYGQVNALGGTYIALDNDTVAPVFTNTGNPASYPSVRLTTFEVGAQSNFSTFNSNSASVKKNNTGLNYMSLAFPIGKRAGGAFGVTPFTNVGYSITDQKEVANIGTVKELYEGSGGANQLFLGLGTRPFNNAQRKWIRREKMERAVLIDSGAYYSGCVTKRDSIVRDSVYFAKWKKRNFWMKTLSSFSMGANGTFLFGNMNHSGVIIYPSSAGVYNTKRAVDTQVRDFNGNGGIQFTFEVDSIKQRRKDSINGKVVRTKKWRDLKSNVRFTIGYNATLPRGINATSSTIATTFIYGPFQREYVQDTVLNNSNVKGKIVLPFIHGIGFCFKKGNYLTVLGDVEMQLWKGYKFFDETNTFKNAMRYSVGMQIVPNRLAIGEGSYFKRIQYRVGARYSDGYIELKNRKITDYAVTAGLGLPMGRLKFWSTVNISVEYGRVGTVQDNLIQQKYIRAVLGFTFNDRWFIKTKYD